MLLITFFFSIPPGTLQFSLQHQTSRDLVFDLVSFSLAKCTSENGCRKIKVMPVIIYESLIDSFESLIVIPGGFT